MRGPFAGLLAAVASATACAPLPEPESIARRLAPDVPVHLAGPGQIMVIGPGPGVEAADPGFAALVFMGMRSSNEAVFERRVLPALPGQVRQTGVPGVFVPIQPGPPSGSAGFLPPRRDDARPDGAPAGTISEIVLRPAAGAVFGADDVMISVVEIRPELVRYQIDTF